MKTHSSKCLLIFFLIFITFENSYAKQSKPIFEILNFDHFLNKTQQWMNTLSQTKPHKTQLKLSVPTVAAAVLCFTAATISSAGGIGGGGLFVPILTIVAGLNLKTASAFSAFMVTGGSIANVFINLLSACPRYGAGKTLIDFDIALLSQPSMLLGVSVGVICNLVFPEWLVTILFAVFLAWSTSKTCKNGVVCWKTESEEHIRRNVNGFSGDDGNYEGNNKDNKSLEVPLLVSAEENCKPMRFPWLKLGILILVWCSFCFLYLLRGNRDGKGISAIKPCGLGYWLLSLLQIPLALVYTAWIICRKDSFSYQTFHPKDIENPTHGRQLNKLTFPVMALFAGVLGGVFGIGGGMLISPLLLQVGITPEVTAATCSFMVFFSSTMSSFQYLLLGMEHIDIALIYSTICLVASLLGLMVVHKAIQQYGRASLIVFSVSIVMALSAVLMTSYGALDVWRNYISGEYMGFKLPC